jgi:hypothetical protein
MIDLQPAPVPDLSEEWIASHRTALVESLSERRRRPIKWVALAGATGVGVTVSSLVLVGGSEPYAFAGWSASPTAATTGQVAAADSTCQAQLTQLGSTNKGIDAASLKAVLSDVRGPYTVTAFSDGGQNEALCVSSPGAIALRWIGRPDTPVSPGAIAIDQISILAREGQPYTLVVGRVGTNVTGVTLSLGNGSSITTTSGSGLLVAWWPGSQTITSANVTTATGVTTQPLNLQGPVLGSPGPKTPPPSVGTPPSSPSGSGNANTVCLIRTCGFGGGDGT